MSLRLRLTPVSLGAAVLSIAAVGIIYVVQGHRGSAAPLMMSCAIV